MDSRHLPAALTFEPPHHWVRIVTLETHTAGEPLRVVVSGFPELLGETVLEYRRDARQRFDPLRRALMWEPRGHADMYGCVVTPPERADSSFGVLFLHNEGFSTMCGHGVLAMARVAVEVGMVEVEEPETVIRMDTPAGQVTARVEVLDGRALRTSFVNVPSYVVGLDRSVEVPGLGLVRYDLAFGGAFYAYVEAGDLGLSCRPEAVAELQQAAKRIKAEVARHDPVTHPQSEELSLLYGVVFCGPAESVGAHSRNLCVFADGEVDRSPTGTSVSARLALLEARGELDDGETVVIESVIGTCFEGRIIAKTDFFGHTAVVPEVAGEARLLGRSEWWIDPQDELAHGFLIR